METPYYLKSEVKVLPFGSVDLFDFETPSPDLVGSPKGVWDSMSENINQAGDYVWDSASATWKSLKTETAEIFDAVVDAGEKAYSWVKWEIIMWLGVALLVVWYVAKSGILKQAAGLL